MDTHRRSATTSARPRAALPYRLLPALCGGVWMLGLSRYLYEAAPDPVARLAGGWPGALILASLGAALAALLVGVLARALPRTDPRALAAAFTPGLLPLVALPSPGVNLLRAGALLLAAPPLALVLLLRAALCGPRRPRVQLLLSLGSWLFPTLLVFGLYLRSLAPTVGEADTFEFQVDIARLAIAHPTGYPLFILIGKLFTLLPLGGTLAFRANLASATFGALAALGGYALARRLGAGRLVSALTCLLVGVSPTLWSRSVEAEVYSLHAALVAALLWLMLCLEEGGTLRGKEEEGRRKKEEGRRKKEEGRREKGHFAFLVSASFFLFGLSLTNHLTSLLLAPALLLSLLLARKRPSFSPPSS
ncbi:MAG: DUF2723 domain-containing protein, partial [Chloroflexi bacterium]|nr:DUF2723 domain-containing protein [Chloroflexota bacterium]